MHTTGSSVSFYLLIDFVNMEKRNTLLEKIHMISWQSHAKRQLEETVFVFFGHFVCVDTFSQFIWLLSCHTARYFILERQQPNHKTHARQKWLQRPVWCLVMAKHQCIVLGHVCNCPRTTDLYFEIKMVFWSGCIMFDMI